MTIHQDPELVMTLQSVIEFIGTFAFALSGIRLAASKHYDWLGGFVCGVAVAIGGGTIRDVMLGLNPFWMSSPIYLLFTFLAQLVVIVCHHYLKRLDNTWFLFDTLGLAQYRRNPEDPRLWFSILGSYHYGMYHGLLWRSDPRCASQRGTGYLPQGNLCDGLCVGRPGLLGIQLSGLEPLCYSDSLLPHRLHHPPARREIPYLAAYAA